MRENWYRWVLFGGLGVWIAGGLAAVLGAGAVALDLGPWWAGVAIGVLSGVVGAFAAAPRTYDRSMHGRVHGTAGVVLFVGVPVAMLVGTLAYLVLSTATVDAIASALFAGAVLSTVGGGVVLLANVPLWKATVQSDSTAYASWTARQPPAQRRRSKYAAGVLAVVAVAVVVGTFVVDGDLPSSNWWVVLAPLTAVFASVENERTVEVRDGGVLVDSSLVAWGDLDGFELTDDALVLHRDGRWFDRTYRFDRADVDDPDGAVAALERFLDRRDEDGSRGRRSSPDGQSSSDL